MTSTMNPSTRRPAIVHALPVVVLVLVALGGCGKQATDFHDDAIATAGQPAIVDNSVVSPAAKEAQQLFTSLCATCHGAQGRGDGAAAASLNPKPRDYSDKAWQASVTDDQLREVILKGGAAVGKAATMPASPQLETKPEVLTELVKMVRAYGQ